MSYKNFLLLTIISFVMNNTGYCFYLENKNSDTIITINEDYCICESGTISEEKGCQIFCAQKSPSTSTLHLSVDTSNHPRFDESDLEFICSDPNEETNTQPGCHLEVASDSDAKILPVQVDGNQLAINLSGIDRSKLHKARLKVLDGSDSERINTIVSNVIQINTIPDKNSDGSITSNPLLIEPVNSYYCLSSSGSLEPDNPTALPTIDHTTKIYYFSSESSPSSSVSPHESPYIKCHDVNVYGNEDSALYPRLGLQKGVFSIWSMRDIRFFDRDSNGVIDINDRINRLGLLEENINPFYSFSWPNSPAFEGDTLPRLGFLLKPFFNDPETNSATCPSYEGDQDARTLTDVLQVETQALYMARGEEKVFTDENGNTVNVPNDFLLLPWDQLSKIAFYPNSDGVLTFHDNNTIEEKPIMFFWPANTDQPLLEQNNQRLYQVVHPSELTSPPNLEDPIPADKRFACTPVQ